MTEQRLGNRYQLGTRLLPGDPARGVPELWSAHDAGDVYFAKRWKRNGDYGGAIQTLWNREVRSLSRLQGYPGAGELFVRLQDLGQTDREYFAILEGGRRTLLSSVLQNRSRYHWLMNLNEVGRRRPLWEGLLRIAEAISVLHNEGTLHRAISSASVFTTPDGAADFRLSGFEWSLRVASSDQAASKVGQRYHVRAPELENDDAEYSMATDWFDFGLLAAEIFGVAVSGFRKRDSIRDAVAKLAHLRHGEREAISHFLQDDVEQRIASGDATTKLLTNIVRDLNVATAGIGRSLILALRLGGEREISRTIQHVSNDQAPAADPMAQRRWIEHDLRGDVRVVSRTSPYPHFVLKGEKLEYRVRQWDVDGLKSWDLGYCENLEQKPRVTPDDQYFSFGERKLDILLYPDARRNKHRLRDRAANWERILPFRKSRTQIAPDLRDVHDFFRVTQQLETVLTAAQICPITVLSTEQTAAETEIVVTPREETARNELAQALRLSPPPEQMRDWFRLGVEEVVADDEDDPKRDTYQLLNYRTIKTDEGSNVDWRFISAVSRPNGPQYTFRTQGSVPAKGPGYIARNYGGTIAQIRRRHKAIEEMRTHEDLLRLLADPVGVSRQTAENLPPERLQIPLDRSKTDALEKLWRTQPSFTAQGPPGTGKTTLIQAFSDRLLASDPTAQILITAHSHHTVDDVLNKLHKRFEALEAKRRPILIRIGAKEENEFDVGISAREMLSRLRESSLYAAAPETLQRRLDKTLEKMGSRDEAAIADFRTMQLLVQDSANITFTTSNAADLEQIGSRGRRFDWSIIEEAGKAHGFDMAAALQASHRLLLIGDHFQLAPFNAIRFRELLGDPLRVRKAIQVGVQFAPGLVDPALVEEDEEREEFVDRCANWRRMVDLFAVLFESSAAGGENGPAATLTNQHRMHPDIAQIVGRAFYPDGKDGTILETPKEARERFERAPPYKLKAGSLLPPQRVIWRDVPWVQKVEWSEGETDGLFSAPAEAKAIINILDEILPAGDQACEVQILSPYNDQLALIKTEIENAKRRGRLSHMFEPPFDLRSGKRMGATVDEFQGSESDIVIVSLVRNNGLVPWKSIGFLKEPNRMNVLLSRARHKLIIVGSWDFFKSRCNETTSPDVEYYYLARMMSVMEGASSVGTLAVAK
jgi:serine/threonine protein kinase